MGFGNLVGNHEPGEIDCPGCDEQWGFCSCGGVIHCEYQEVWASRGVTAYSKGILVLECDRCDEYEVE